VRAELEVHMSRLGAVLFVLIAASVDAQTDPQAIILSALSDCIRDAIASSSVKANDDLFFHAAMPKPRSSIIFSATRFPLKRS